MKWTREDQTTNTSN